MTSGPLPARRWRARFVWSSVYLSPAAATAFMLIAWEVASRAGYFPRYLLPAPTGIVRRFVELHGVIARESLVTLQEILLGFGASVVLGVPLAVALVSSRALDRALYPLIVGSQVVPKVGIAPLFLVWFGFGLVPKVLVAFLVAFFPIVVSTVFGLRSIEVEKLYVGRAAGASAFQLFRSVRLPYALPSIFGGMKVSITLAVVGAIVGEFVAAESGVGRLLLSANGNMDTELLFAGLFALVIIGVVLFLLIEGLERLILPWHASQRVEAATRMTT